MVVEGFLSAVGWVVNGIFTAIPDIPVPGWFTGSIAAIQALFGAATTMGVWVPVPLAISVAALLFTALMGGAIIKLVRIIASFLTAGGGSAS
jgi:hypothetical protein